MGHDKGIVVGSSSSGMGNSSGFSGASDSVSSDVLSKSTGSKNWSPGLSNRSRIESSVEDWAVSTVTSIVQ